MSAPLPSHLAAWPKRNRACTVHAIDRIAERCPGITAERVAAQIAADLVSGGLVEIHQSVTGESICEMTLETGQTIFPVLDADCVVTVLTAGMETCTTTGRVLLGEGA